MLTKQIISPQILQKILGQFDLGEIKKIKPLATSGNITYLVKSRKKDYLLRFSPLGPRWRSKKEIEAELELFFHLLQNKFSVPKPILTKNGQVIVFWKKHYGYLREFIVGKSKLNPKLEEIRKFGRLLCRYHNLIRNYRTKNRRNHIWDLEKTRNNFKEDKKLILRSNFPYKKDFLKRFIKEITKLNFPDELPEGTIHEDLGKRHVLWQKGKIVGIIDFDRCYYGKLVLDLGQACRGWCFVNNWKRWSNKNFNALISGYQKERKLTESEKNFLIDAIKFGILERGLSFSLRYKSTQDKEDADYAMHSVSKDGLLAMIEKNRKTIEKILNKKK